MTSTNDMRKAGAGHRSHSQSGFSLVEVVVVMGILMTVLLITTTAFKTLAGKSAGIMRSAESNIEGVVGLELFRSDIEHAGVGLAWGFQNRSTSTISYAEAASSGWVPGVDANTLNDSPSGVPRAVVGANNAGVNGSDYLAIKGTYLGRSATARKWTYLGYSAGGVVTKRWGSKDDLVVDERIIVLKPTYVANSGMERRLIVDPSGAYYTKFALPVASPFWPVEPTETHLVYGVDPSTDLRMPFNRVDYFLYRPSTAGSMPAMCAPNTANLYRGSIRQSNGTVEMMPILDCVADLQVIYSLDTNADGGVDLHVAPGEVGAPVTAEDIRRQVKEIRAYVLAQEGGRDNSFTYPSDTVTVGEFGKGSNFDLLTRIGTGWQNYRWKVYNIIVKLKNLQ